MFPLSMFNKTSSAKPVNGVVVVYYVERLRKIEPQLFVLLYIWRIKSLVIKYYILAIDILFLQLRLR